jgi:hypothetical protein
MKSLIISIVFIISFVTVSFAQNITEVSSEIKAEISYTVISEVMYANIVNNRDGVTIQRVVIDGEIFYHFVNISKVVFITNEGTDEKNTFWFGNQVSEREIKRIMKKEKSEGISFNCLNEKGMYVFGTEFNRPFDL